jgi:hypothetical protein
MKRLPLVLGALSAIGFIAAITLYLFLSQQRDRLETTLTSERQRAAELAAELNTSRDQSAAHERRVRSLEVELNEARQRAGAADQRAVSLARDLNQARQETAQHVQAEGQRQQELATLKRELLQQRLTAIAPDEIEALRHQLAAQQRRIDELESALADAQQPVRNEAEIIPPPRPILARILSVGPKSAFVVLEYGTSQGAALTQLLHVRRGEDAIATVEISDVRENLSIAHVRPASLRASLRHGDLASLQPHP